MMYNYLASIARNECLLKKFVDRVKVFLIHFSYGSMSCAARIDAYTESIQKDVWGRMHVTQFLTKLFCHAQITAYYCLGSTEKINENFREHNPHLATIPVNCT